MKRKMSPYLAGLEQFSVQTENTLEVKGERRAQGFVGKEDEEQKDSRSRPMGPG
jgi:hypothetical protein